MHVACMACAAFADSGSMDSYRPHMIAGVLMITASWCVDQSAPDRFEAHVAVPKLLAGPSTRPSIAEHAIARLPLTTDSPWLPPSMFSEDFVEFGNHPIVSPAPLQPAPKVGAPYAWAAPFEVGDPNNPSTPPTAGGPTVLQEPNPTVGQSPYPGLYPPLDPPLLTPVVGSPATFVPPLITVDPPVTVTSSPPPAVSPSVGNPPSLPVPEPSAGLWLIAAAGLLRRARVKDRA